MNPIKIIKRLFNNTKNHVFNINTSALTGKDLFGFMWRSKQHNTESSLTLSAVFCATNLYIGAIGSLPRTVYKLGLDGNVTRQLGTLDHPAVKIFQHYANPNYSSDDFITDVVNDVINVGNYYALKEYDSQQRTSRLYYIHPSRVPRGNIFFATGNEDLSTGRKANKHELIYRIETGDSKQEENAQFMLLPKDMIFHIKGIIPDKAHNRSFGVIENAVRSFNMYENSEEYGVQFYKSGYKNQVFLSTEQRLASEVQKRVEGYFEANPNAPLESAFKTRILEQGLKPINTAMPMAELQFIETRAFSVEDVGRWYSVPPVLLHSQLNGKIGTSNIQEMIHLFIQTGLHPVISRIRNQIKNELLPLSSQQQYSFEFNLIYLFRTIINEFSQALRNLFEIGVMDRVEIANLLGMKIDPKDSNNALRYVPTNLMTVEHSLALKDKAILSNELLEKQIEAAQLANDNYVSPLELAAASKPDKTEADKPDKQDESPDQHNIDKKIRTAKNSLIAVLHGLQHYEIKVLNQKFNKNQTSEELASSINEFYTDEKFCGTLLNTLHEWEDQIKEWTTFSSVNQLIEEWKIHSLYCISPSVNSIENVLEFHKDLNLKFTSSLSL